MSRTHACFTAHLVACGENPQAEFWKKCPEGVNYIVWQWEKCPTTGNLHMQGYAEFPNKIRWAAAGKRLGLGLGTHWEYRKGTQYQAIEYCKKPEREFGPWELGQPAPCQGARSDLKECFEMIKNGASLLDIAEKQPGDAIRYHAGFSKLIMLSQKNVFEEKTVTVFVGETNAGKSHKCWENAGINAYAKDGSKWWDGYIGQEDVVISDYDGAWPLIFLLNLFDKWPCRVESKGSSCMMKAKRFWIGSNIHPSEWYKKAPKSQIDALLRRLTIELLERD